MFSAKYGITLFHANITVQILSGSFASTSPITINAHSFHNCKDLISLYDLLDLYIWHGSTSVYAHLNMFFCTIYIWRKYINLDAWSPMIRASLFESCYYLSQLLVAGFWIFMNFSIAKFSYFSRIDSNTGPYA